MHRSVLGIALVVMTLFSVGCTRVSAGHVGVQSTMTGSSRGLADVSVGPAWVFYNPLTASVFEYPTFVQTAVWTHDVNEGHPTNEEITFTVQEGLSVAADISLAYSLQPEKVPAFYLKFRSDDLKLFTHGFLRNMARQTFDDVAGKYSVDSVMGDNAKFLAQVKVDLQSQLDPYGVHLDQFGFIGSPRPPQTVIDSIMSKVKATQIAIQKQNELLQSQADAAKQVAEAKGNAEATIVNADAQAQSNRKLADSLSPSLVQYRMIDKWDGKLPSVQSGGGGGMILSLPSVGK